MGAGTQAAKPNLIVENFEGVVMLKQWIHGPDGKQYIGFGGKVSIIRDKAAVGFEVSGGESNWIARIAGETSSVNVLGCQIRGAYEGPMVRDLSTDFYRVP